MQNMYSLDCKGFHEMFTTIDQLIDFFEIKHKEYPWDRQDALKWWKEYDAYS